MAAQNSDLNGDDMVFLYSLHSDVLLAAKEPRRELQNGEVKKCWAASQEEKFEEVWHFLNPSSQNIWRVGVAMITSASIAVM